MASYVLVRGPSGPDGEQLLPFVVCSFKMQFDFFAAAELFGNDLDYFFGLKGEESLNDLRAMERAVGICGGCYFLPAVIPSEEPDNFLIWIADDLDFNVCHRSTTFSRSGAGICRLYHRVAARADTPLFAQRHLGSTIYLARSSASPYCSRPSVAPSPLPSRILLISCGGIRTV